VSLVDVERLRQIAEVEFADIVADGYVPDLNELRIVLIDGSFMDAWFSLSWWGVTAIIGNIAPLTALSIAMTMRHTGAGSLWQPSPTTFTMAVKATWSRVTSVRVRRVRCGNSWPLYESGWASCLEMTDSGQMMAVKVLSEQQVVEKVAELLLERLSPAKMDLCGCGVRAEDEGPKTKDGQRTTGGEGECVHSPAHRPLSPFTIR
jgi:hypothetical protein